MFLEDGNWQEADAYCERVLDIEPENARAYLGKLMAELRVPTQNKLKNNPNPLAGLDNHKKALRFADDSLRTALTEADEHIHQRNLHTAYCDARRQMKAASNMIEFNHVAELFSGISDFEDADKLREECIRRAENSQKMRFILLPRKKWPLAGIRKQLRNSGLFPTGEMHKSILLLANRWQKKLERKPKSEQSHLLSPVLQY